MNPPPDNEEPTSDPEAPRDAVPPTPSYFLPPSQQHTQFVTQRNVDEEPAEEADIDLEALTAAEAKIAGRSVREQRRLMENGFASWIKRRGPAVLLVMVLCYFLWMTFQR